jgi:hypothetical protein
MNVHDDTQIFDQVFRVWVQMRANFDSTLHRNLPAVSAPRFKRISTSGPADTKYTDETA